MLVLVAGSIALACGGGAGTTGGASPNTVTPSANATLKFSTTDAPSQPAGSIKVVMQNMAYSPKTMTAPSGRVVFYLVNAEPVPCPLPDCRHDMVITTLDNRPIAYSDHIEAGKSKVFTIESLPAGKYLFHDDIGAHNVELHMSGTLDVS